MGLLSNVMMHLLAILLLSFSIRTNGFFIVRFAVWCVQVFNIQQCYSRCHSTKEAAVRCWMNFKWRKILWWHEYCCSNCARWCVSIEVSWDTTKWRLEFETHAPTTALPIRFRMQSWHSFFVGCNVVKCGALFVVACFKVTCRHLPVSLCVAL